MKHDLRQRLQNIPSGQMDLDALSEVIVSMAEISRVEGLLALEEMADESSRMENLLKKGIRLTVDGTATDLVTNLMTTTMQALVHNYQLRCQMIIEGVKAVQNGGNPRIVETRLHSFYKPQAHL
jgi:flagellar motor component MotA